MRAPVAVRMIDVDRPGTLELARDGVPYQTALLVAIADGRPIGEVSLGVEGVDRLSGVRLRELIGHECWSRVEMPPSPDRLPEVSVVVATRADPGSVIATVASVLACDQAALQVIVVENRRPQSPVPAALLERFGGDERIRYLAEQRPGLAAARNAGLRVATGEVLAFIGDDVEVDGGWVGWIARAFAADPDVGCVTGLVLPRDLETPEQVPLEQSAGFGKGYERREYRLSQPAPAACPFAACEFGSSASAAVRVGLLRSLDGFDAALGPGIAADLDLYIHVLLAGYALAYEPAAILWQRHPGARKQLPRRLFDYGAAVSAMVTKYALLGYGPAILRRVPGAAGNLSKSVSKNIGRAEDRPALAWIERAGMLLGPVAYAARRRQERLEGYAPTGLGQITFRPAWVGQIDVTAPALTLEPPRAPGGARYERARLLARRGEVPLGFIEVPLQEGVASANAVSAELGRQLPQASRREPAASTELSPPLPRITVVVCTRDRPDALRGALTSILAVDYEDYELLVVDNAPASTATKDLVSGLADPRVRYVLEPVAGLSRARNRAVAEAAGEIIAFTDDDVVVDRGWLRAIVRGFQRSERVACVTGLVLPAELDTVAQAYFDATVKWSASFAPRLFDLDEHPGTDALFPYRAGNFGAGANFAAQTAAAARLGAFDEALGAGSRTGGGEDLDFFARVILAGHTIAYEPSSLVWHSHRSELEALRKQTFTYRCGLSAYAFKHLTTRHAMRVVLAAALRGRPANWPTPVVRPLIPPIRGMLGGEIAGFAVGPARYLRGRLLARLHPPLSEQAGAHVGAGYGAWPSPSAAGRRRSIDD